MTTDASDPKFRGDVAAPEEEKEKVDIKKFYQRKSKPITLSGGDFIVRDLSATSIMVMMGACADILVIVADNFDDEGDIDPLTVMTIAARLPKFKDKLATFFALCCGAEDDPESLEFFRELPISDTKVLFEAIQEVVDFDEISKTFLEGGLLDLLKPTSTATQE